DLFLSGMLFIIYGIGLLFFHYPSINLLFIIIAPILVFLVYKIISPNQRRAMQLTSLTTEQNKLGILSYLLTLTNFLLLVIFMFLQVSITVYGFGSEEDIFSLFGAFLFLPGFFGAIATSLTLGVGAIILSLYDLRKAQEFKFSIPMTAIVSVLGFIFILIGIINGTVFFFTITVAVCLGSVTLGVTLFIDYFNHQEEKFLFKESKTLS
ncbi:MAG: hypothetical protein ACFFBD_21700, partial [Candidatus Hodarchaeota archaeon]